MKEQHHFGRWLVIGIVTMVAVATGMFVAARPLARMRIPRVPSRADETQKLDVTDQPIAGVAWIEGDSSTIAPEAFPVKVNERSGIYHLVGDWAYDRTVSTRNYRSAEVAQADGFRHAYR